mmetsp:Transcript_78470/g.211039  ORF Transcript_78470/g.211039 Transcript_78470/m.211039 type:complete len:120 (+) Transcript_78470:466-825(+)
MDFDNLSLCARVRSVEERRVINSDLVNELCGPTMWNHCRFHLPNKLPDLESNHPRQHKGSSESSQRFGLGTTNAGRFELFGRSGSHFLLQSFGIYRLSHLFRASFETSETTPPKSAEGS